MGVTGEGVAGDGPTSEISFDQFMSVDIRAGTILEAKLNPKAQVPAYELTIDFGDLGIKKSSAKITENYHPSDLVGLNIVAVVNFPPKRVAGVKSEVLVLASVCEKNGTVLLSPTKPVQNGTRVL